MLLRNLKLNHLRLFRDVEIPFEQGDGGPRPWTVFIGENGTGKTTILQAIALAAAGNAGLSRLGDEVKEQLPDVRADSAGASEIHAEFAFGAVGRPARRYPYWPGEGTGPSGVSVKVSIPRGKDPIRSIAWYAEHSPPEQQAGTEESDPLVKARADDMNHWFVVGYGMHRYLQENQPGQLASPWPSIDRLKPLFKPVSLIGPNFADRLDTSLRRDFARLLQQIIRQSPQMLPGIKDVELRGYGGVRTSEDLKGRNRFTEQIGETMRKLPATWLAHGYQSMLAWLFDLVGQVLLEAQQAVDPADMEGIVLIDEIDLYLHPLWQVELIRALRNTFKKLQFIATTHSPILLTGLRREEVIVLKRDESSGDISWRHPERDPRLLTGSELYEEFFGIRELYPTDLARTLNAYRMLAMNPNRPEGKEQDIDRLEKALKDEGIPVHPRVPRRDNRLEKGP